MNNQSVENIIQQRQIQHQEEIQGTNNKLST